MLGTILQPMAVPTQYTTALDNTSKVQIVAPDVSLTITNGFLTKFMANPGVFDRGNPDFVFKNIELIASTGKVSFTIYQANVQFGVGCKRSLDES